jgi:tetratricopeptide (TPR) repeat protein
MMASRMAPNSTGHPSSAELAALLRGELDPLRAQEVLDHLLRPCESCLESVLNAPETETDRERATVELTPEQDADYEAAIDRAFAAVRRHERHLRGQRAQATKILKRLEQGDDLNAAAKLPLTSGAYAKFRALLDRSWALRHEDPIRMVRLALLAVKCAEQLDARTYGIQWVFDFQCEAQAALGNAFRVAQQLAKAETALSRARELFELGTHSPLLEICLLEREAALDADQRRFKPATLKLEMVYRYYRQTGDDHLAGRALVQQGLYMTYAGESERALRILRRSLALIDDSVEPTLAYAALQNQIRALCDCGRFREAERQLFLLRPLRHHAGGRINELKLRWVEGQIDAGVGRLERAEEVFLEVREGMAAVNRAYDAAIASLDLAAVLIALRRTDQAKEIVLTAYQTFVALRIEREALVAVMMLKYSFEKGVATRGMVEEVAVFLRRFENNPSLKFDGKAWEEE